MSDPSNPITPEPQRTTEIPDVKQPNNTLSLSLDLRKDVDRRRLEALKLLLEVQSLPLKPLFPTAAPTHATPAEMEPGTASISATEGAPTAAPPGDAGAASPKEFVSKPHTMILMLDTEGPWP